MATAADRLPEPQVLAHTKRRLFPEDGEPNTYAVVDTQFSTDEWLDDHRVDREVRETLAPFNHVRIGSGYPDLVGVRKLESELLAVERFGEDPPLVVVEAKGHTGRGGVDTHRGIVQAYDRLHEANAAYLAAPAGSVSQSDRALASELNVGILGVGTDGGVDPLVVPRVVGNRTTDEATAIRFQASTQGVAEKSFGLNHPKNYLAYPIAVHHHGDTETLIERHVVGAVDDARRGAEFLGLVDVSPDGVSLTPLGREVVRFARRTEESLDDALAAFEEWKRSRRRFCEVAPQWGLLTRWVVFEYPAAELLVTELQTMHGDGITDPTLVDVVVWLHEQHPTFTVELFLKGDETFRGRVLDGDGDLRHAALSDGEVYHSPTVFQLKAMLYHAGILTERGAEPSNLDPTRDVWKLREPL